MTRTNVSRIARLLPAVGLMLLLLPSAPATAQATRTWVSGTGDDVNPCSRTAPCKTFAGAISKTAAGGEINVIDSGGFGAVTITKSITIQACNAEAGVLVSGTNGIVVQAGATDRVILRCLDFNGLGPNNNFLSPSGVRWTSGKSLKIADSDIYGFGHDAILLQSSTSGAKAYIVRNFLHDNLGAGVMLAPPAGVAITSTVRNNDITENGCGVVAAQFGAGGAVTTDCGTLASGGSNGIAIQNVLGNTITQNTAAGVYSRGVQAVQRLGLNEVMSNTNGLQSVDSGQILSFGNNLVTGNNTNGAPTGPVIPPMRHAR